MEAGRVGRPHGLDGSFTVTRPYTSALAAPALVIAGAAREVVRRFGTDDRPLLRVTGCSSRAEAEAWRGETVWAPRSVLPELEQDEYYVEDVEGCAVFDGTVEIGVVRRMYPLPSCHVLEVARPSRPDLLVPLVRDAVRAVDVAARRVDVSLAFLGEEP